MRTHIKLGKLFGIDVGLHYSWFFIAVLIVVSLADYFRAADPGWSTAVVWAMSTLSALFFFLSLVLHEVSHALVARSRNLPVRAITLFALGGVAQIERGAASAPAEFWMAIAGPVASAAIGLASLAVAMMTGWRPGNPEGTPLLAMVVWLGYMNLGLAVFNMIPGYPMDGGRVLRAAIWWKTGSADKATRFAARAGQVVGILFMAWGIARFLLASSFGGLWMALIGLFLVRASRESYAEAGLRRLLEGVRVADVMARDCPVVSGYMNLQAFVTEALINSERRCFIVEENGIQAGIVSPSDLEGIDRARWPYTTLRDIMRPFEELRAVDPDTPVMAALELMARDHLAQLPVISHGHLDGILSRRQVARFLQTRTV
jgi:Zn-dependent protease/predicted transcriptional regulator